MTAGEHGPHAFTEGVLASGLHAKGWIPSLIQLQPTPPTRFSPLTKATHRIHKERTMSASPARTVADTAKRTVKLIKCQVTVKTGDGAQHSYGGLFQSTCDAVMDAFDRFGLAKISAKAMS